MGERQGGSYTADPKTGAERRVEGTEAAPIAAVAPADEAAETWTIADPAVPAAQPVPAASQAPAPAAAPAASPRRSGGSAPAAQE